MPENLRSEQPSSTGRVAVLDALRSLGGPTTVHALAERTGLHPNTVRFHLAKLVQVGLVHEDRGEASGPGRPRLQYGLAPAPPTDNERHDTAALGEYRLLSQILAGYLAAHSDNPGEAAASAGRQWGQYLVERPPPYAQLDDAEIRRRITDMLRDLGFEPETHDSGEVKLHRCPFREVAQQQPAVVCSVHLGLLQGAMDELGAGAAAATLRPFVTDRLCVAHLSGRQPVSITKRPPDTPETAPDSHPRGSGSGR